ncbi:asparaginase [Edaphobacillus lindanitolerans]|uniref:asparaginase n=1 Tax=Edaphobacillus lindanitolerans TaxID=550447 RepID=A0A1U7PIW4_9BACI|nr:asparaginase [Edaphobacillus lindanitolerans]SIT66584.1 L-asparaginase [Edaphobacillus lindanitolerans]
MKKTLLLIHTGGTISMTTDEAGSVSPAQYNPIMGEFAKLDVLGDIIEMEAFNLPSPHITPRHMLELKLLIERTAASQTIDGVVITHGTDTLEETAFFLDLTLDGQIPVVLTGAMRSADEIGSDGVHNVLSAIRVASDDESRGKGVLVVLNDEIHTAQNVTKTHTSNVSTFQSPQYGPIGLVANGHVHFHHAPLSRPHFEIGEIGGPVALLKVYAGMDSEFLIHSAAAGYAGVVLEGLGQGNVPPSVLPGIRRLLEEDIPVVLVSRCFNGIAQPVYGYEGGGRMLEEEGVIFAHGLSGQKARLQLLIALSAGLPVEEIAKSLKGH